MAKRHFSPPIGYNLNGTPCIQDGYLYRCCQDTEAILDPALCRIHVSDIGKSKGVWRQPLPYGYWRRQTYLFSFSGCLYAMLCDYGWKSKYEIYRRDIAGDWYRLESLPLRLFDFGIVVVGSALLVVGGLDSSSQPSSSVLAFNLRKYTWKSLSNLPFACVRPHVVKVLSFVHVFANHIPTGQIVITMDVISGLESGSWQRYVLPPVPNHVRGAVVMNDQLVVLCKDYTYVDDHQCREFLEVTTPCPCDFCYCLSYDNVLYALPSSPQSSSTIHVLSA